MNLRIYWVLAALFVSFTSIPTQAQSFNCTKADAPDEVLICQSTDLKELDQEMSSLYFQIRNKLPEPQRSSLEEGQVRWLQSRMACGRDYSCIEDHYLRRISRLHQIAQD
jgi:uncharacterized protein